MISIATESILLLLLFKTMKKSIKLLVVIIIYAQKGIIILITSYLINLVLRLTWGEGEPAGMGTMLILN